MPSIKYKVRKSVSQHLLRRYVELSSVVKDMEDVKQQIIEGLKQGLPCQPGPIKAKLRVRAGSRRPKWRLCYEHLAAGLYEAAEVERMITEVIDNTDPGRDSYSLEVFD